jgi:hypothetical protein
LNRKIFFTITLALFAFFGSNAQDTLPRFSVNNKGNNRILISWYNKFATVKQISIQRSTDSLNNYKTILTVPDPANKQNGFMDTKAPSDQMFYRLYILLDGGNFLFTKATRPVHDSVLFRALIKEVSDTVLARVISKSLTDSTLTPEEMVILKKYKDSRMELEKDSTVLQINGNIKDKNKTELNVPSYRIVTNREGNVRIRLADFYEKKYSIKFFEEDETLLFEIKEVKEAFLLLDKSNFHHSGWFSYELYADEKLVEKHKFFIPKDF